MRRPIVFGAVGGAVAAAIVAGLLAWPREPQRPGPAFRWRPPSGELAPQPVVGDDGPVTLLPPARGPVEITPLHP